ncbi:MAG: hypothetical protein ACREQK_01575 [Candidatus Binatia bacterium]
MAREAILQYSAEKGFRKQTTESWLELPEADGEALLGLAEALRIGENHFRDVLDWLEEIALRDGIDVRTVLGGDVVAKVLDDPRLGRNDKLKRVKEELWRLRYPRLAEAEEEIRRRIRELKLSPRIQMSAPLNLEGGALTVQLRATTQEELRRLMREVSEATEKKAVGEIFDLLAGKGTRS